MAISTDEIYVQQLIKENISLLRSNRDLINLLMSIRTISRESVDLIREDELSICFIDHQKIEHDFEKNISISIEGREYRKYKNIIKLFEELLNKLELRKY